LVIPDDIGVMGFDNLAESEYFHPSLTTIQHDHIRVGTLAVKELIRIIDAIEDNQAVEYRVIRLEPELLVRESSTGVK
jgi:LacI family transcriptional regulator